MMRYRIVEHKSLDSTICFYMVEQSERKYYKASGLPFPRIETEIKWQQLDKYDTKEEAIAAFSALVEAEKIRQGKLITTTIIDTYGTN